LPAVQGYVHSRRAVAVLIALMAIFVAGCGSSSSSGSSTPVSARTRTYLTSMCTAMAPVIRDFSSFQTALANARSSDLAKYKQNVELILSAMVQHAAHAVAGLQQAGQPDVSQGNTIAHGVVAEFTAFHSAFVAAESSANSIPTVNTHQFQLALGGLVATLSTSLGGANALGAKLKAPSLAGAEEVVPACATIAR
jgi:hypothetical protein